MTKKLGILAMLIVVGITGTASAATGSGSLAVTGTIEGTIALTVESAGGTTSGMESNSASTALGTISKYGSAPTGFSLTKAASDWTLASTVGIKVVKANITSSDYTLTAQLLSAPASGVNWSVNSSSVDESEPATMTSTGTYGSTQSMPWNIVIADSASAGSIGNTINFIATSN